MDKRRTRGVRKAVQLGWALLTNAHLSGFVTGKIYSGALKHVCVPGMNCYSCPGALGACPLGAVQAMLGARRPRFAFYVVGFLGTLGMLAGRFVCGWLCPFGLIQELLHRIPVKKRELPAKPDKALRRLKYLILALFVVLLPILLRDEYGMSLPYFCKWLCPVGMLEGGIPLLILNKALRPAAHFLYVWKLAILLAVLLAAVWIHRPFCRYFCPLGAFYALFQKISLLQLEVDRTACVRCGACARACGMRVDPLREPNSAECIRCGECVRSCPHGALRFRFAGSERQRESGSRRKV